MIYRQSHHYPSLSIYIQPDLDSYSSLTDLLLFLQEHNIWSNSLLLRVFHWVFWSSHIQRLLLVAVQRYSHFSPRHLSWSFRARRVFRSLLTGLLLSAKLKLSNLKPFFSNLKCLPLFLVPCTVPARPQELVLRLVQNPRVDGKWSLRIRSHL